MINANIKAKLKRLIVRHNQWMVESTLAAERAAAARTSIQNLMITNSIEKMKVELDDGSELSATVARGRTTTTVDADLLKESVSPTVWKRVVKESVDLAKFRDAVACGDIPADVAESVTTTFVSSNYVILPRAKTSKVDHDES